VVKALTIRFGVMCVGMAILDVVLNLTNPNPNLVMLAVMVYVVGGALVIGRYCIAHEDEIPVRCRDDRRR